MLWNSGSYIQPVCHYIWPLLHSFHQPGVICVTRSFHLITFSSREDLIRPFTLLIISVFLWMCWIDSQPKPHWFPSWNKASLRPNLNLPVWLSIRGATVMIPPRFTCQHHFLATVFFFSPHLPAMLRHQKQMEAGNDFLPAKRSNKLPLCQSFVFDS